MTGSIISLAILAGTFVAVRFVSESLINCAINPLFERLWAPVMLRLSDLMGGSGILHDIPVGNIAGNEIDFIASLGMLTTGLYLSFGTALPYVISFYLALGLLEDIGYLPRLAVLVDTLMHRPGLHGYAVIPTLLGFGCHPGKPCCRSSGGEPGVSWQRPYP